MNIKKAQMITALRWRLSHIGYGDEYNDIIDQIKTLLEDPETEIKAAQEESCI
jgi:hypothetical protein